jgi:hypothetical protein
MIALWPASEKVEFCSQFCSYRFGEVWEATWLKAVPAAEEVLAWWERLLGFVQHWASLCQAWFWVLRRLSPNGRHVSSLWVA